MARQSAGRSTGRDGCAMTSPSRRTEQAAADTLTALLTALQPTGTPQDSRIRHAIAAAATALQQGREPLPAALRAHARR